jgi:hypothetical protein
MLIPKDLSNYHSYLLRFWQEQTLERRGTWRFSVEDPHNGTRVGFDSLAELMRFLTEKMDPHGPSAPKPTGAS